MKRLLVLIVLLSGCSGGDFTSGLSDSASVSDAGERTDSAPFLTGGAPGTGGTPGSGGAVAAGGTHATGGAPELEAAASDTGGQPGTGGTDADTAPPSGGVTGTGGTTQAGGSPGTGGSVVTIDAGCALVTHDNGLGQTWQDCVPLGTYNQEQAMKACGVSDAKRCVADTHSCGGVNLVVIGRDAADQLVGSWGYDGETKSFVSSSTGCPSSGLMWD